MQLTLRLALLLAIFLMCSANSIFAAPVIKISEADNEQPESNTPQIPWVDGSKDLPSVSEWMAVPLQDAAGNLRAEARVLLTDSAFLLDLELVDPAHQSSCGGADLWTGDSLQLALDLFGDGSSSPNPELRGSFGPDDIALGVALTDSGPEGWIFFRHASVGRPRVLPKELIEISRDEEKKTTHYRLELPWPVIGTQPGLGPEIGLALLLNDYTPGSAERSISTFGAGADGVPRPGLHARLRLAEPPGTIAAARVGRAAEWSKTEPAEVLIAVGSTAPMQFDAILEGADFPVVVTIHDGKIHRYRLHISQLGAEAKNLQVQILPDETNPIPLLEINEPVFSALGPLQAFESRVAELLAQPDLHPLFEHHLRSLHALVLKEWGRLQLYHLHNPALAQRTVERIQKYTEALHGESGEWAADLDGRRSLLMGFLSPHDGTYQYYQLGLPKDWDPAKDYPLFFELHGVGDDNPLGFPANRLTLGEEAPGLHGYETPKTFAEIQRNGYWVHPFGRGNLGYRGIAEIDIFEVYDDGHKRFNIDEDRSYHYGFSMGGGGTWANALRTPDRWAAIAILAGAPRGELGEKLVPNLQNLPVWIWCGEEDRLFPRTVAMVEALKAKGLEPIYSSSPGVDQSYLGDKQEASVNWLQTHVRKRPDAFQFYTDSDLRTAARGIDLTRDVALSGIPGFQVRLDGNTVHLESEGTPRLTVNPGVGGLGLKGDFTLRWNGEQVYRGPVQHLILADGKATPQPFP